MPHLTALAQQHAGKATFIGLNILETEGATAASVEAFVKKMGADMGYTVAMDDIQTDAAANQWYRAAGLGSIPLRSSLMETARLPGQHCPAA